MEKVKLKSNLLIKLFGRDEISLEEIQDIEDLLLDGQGISFTKEEIENVKSDLVYVFGEIQENQRDIQIANCPEFLKEYIIKNAPTEEIYFEGYEDYFEALKDKEVDVSDEFRKSFGGENEYELYQYVKTSKYLDLKPTITLKDYDAIKKYASITDFKIKIESEQEYQSLLQILDGEKIDVIADKGVVTSLCANGQDVPENMSFVLQIQDMSELSDIELSAISDNINIQSIHIPSVSNGTMESKDCYSIEEYGVLKEKIDNILSQVDNSKPEIDRFMQVYQILGQSIEYEFDDDGEPASRQEAHNLKGRIIRRKMRV